MDQAEPGQFVSAKRECHFQEPYGFVPEAGCQHHNAEEFLDFLAFAERRAKRIEHEKCASGCHFIEAATQSLLMATAIWAAAKQKILAIAWR